MPHEPAPQNTNAPHCPPTSAPRRPLGQPRVPACASPASTTALRSSPRMARPWPTTPPTAADRAAYADAEPRPFWLDGLPARASRRRRWPGATEADLCIVGGGFTGLWAALHAKADDPARDVVLLEAERRRLRRQRAQRRLRGRLADPRPRATGSRASRTRWRRSSGSAARTSTGIEADLARHGIDCEFEQTGDLVALLEPHEEAWLRGGGGAAAPLRPRASRCSTARDARRGRLADLPRRRVGPHAARRSSTPARLADGLREAALRAGVRIHEDTPATALARARRRAVTRRDARRRA